MANDCCAGIYIPLDDSNFKPIIVHDEEKPKVNKDNAESKGSDESDIR